MCVEQITEQRLAHKLNQAWKDIERLNDIRAVLADRAVVAEFRVRQLVELCEAWIASGDAGLPPYELTELLDRLQKEPHGQQRSPYA